MDELQEFRQQYAQHLQEFLMDSTIPQRLLADYDFLSCITINSTKELYRVRRKKDGAPGLLRVTKGEFQESALAEAQILSRLKHPAVPGVQTAFSEGDNGYLVRDYFEGETLSQLVRGRGPLPVRQVLEIGEMVCHVLCHLHAQNPPVIHRDLKPENIILSPDGSIKLIDFDIARNFRWNESNDTEVFITRRYAPPEQFGFSQTDPRSDIYSLGMVMVFLSTGDTEVMDLRSKIPHRGLCALLQDCIEFSPKDRINSAVELLKRIHVAHHWRRKEIGRLVVRSLTALATAAIFILFLELGLMFYFVFSSEPVEFQDASLGYALRETHDWNNVEVYPLELNSQVVELRVYGSVLSPDIWETTYDHDLGEYQYITENGMIENRGGIETLADLAEIKSMRRLTLIKQSIEDLSPLEGLDLTILDLDNNFVEDLSPLAHMTTLEELYVSSNPVVELSPLEGLDQLWFLDISNTNVKDFTPLARMKSLKVLLIRSLPLDSLEFLRQLDHLEELAIAGIVVDDYQPVLEHVGLTLLDASYTALDNLQDFQAPQRLKLLDMTGTPVKSLEGIHRYGELEELRIGDTDVESLEGIGSLSKLEILSVYDTLITDLSPLKDCPGLVRLDISFCQVEDLDVLLRWEGSLEVICQDMSGDVVTSLLENPNLTVITD